MSSSRSRQQPPRPPNHRSSPTSRTTAGQASRSSRPSSQRPPTDVLLAEIQRQADIQPSQFPPTPAHAFSPPGTASHSHMAGQITQAMKAQQQAGPPMVKYEETAPLAPPTAFHSPTYFDRMEYQERERMMQAAKVLGSRELLMRYAILNNESIPQTRLRLQKQLVGIKHTVNPPSSLMTTASSSSSPSSKQQETGIIRDMRPEEDHEKGTWADGEVVVGPGPLVQSTASGPSSER